MKHKDKILLGIILLLLVSNAYFIFFRKGEVQSASVTSERPEDYPFLSKRIFAEQQSDILINFLPLRQKLRETTAPYGDSFGVYFEYLPTGTSIGINEKVDFESASLFKIPMIMAYYRGLEEQGGDKNQTDVIKEQDINKEYGDLWQKGSGYEISLDEAIKRAITQSDNTAIAVIARNSKQADVLEVYEGLDINLTTSKDNIVLITLKGFSSILKSLFFASIVNKENSQHILDYMSQVEYRDAIVAGVPNDVPVAHKIGEIGDRLYMDCGIIYVPSRPYILCMVSATDGAEAAKRMKEVSSEVYKFVSSVSKK